MACRRIPRARRYRRAGRQVALLALDLRSHDQGVCPPQRSHRRDPWVRRRKCGVAARAPARNTVAGL